MNRISVNIAVVLALLMAGCVRQAFVDGDTPEEVLAKRITVGFEEEFELNLGDTAMVDGTDIEITFSFVSGDSRCPSDVVCITQGEASILLLYVDPDIIGRQIRATIPGLVPTPYRENEILHHNGNEIMLLALDPYPDTRVVHSPRDYKARLVIRS